MEDPYSRGDARVDIIRESHDGEANTQFESLMADKGQVPDGVDDGYFRIIGVQAAERTEKERNSAADPHRWLFEELVENLR